MVLNDLPTEIFINILTRLPVKTLIQFTAICKSWCSIINDPHFITTHLKRFTLNRDCQLVHLPSVSSGERSCSVLSVNSFDQLADYKIPFNPEFDTFRIAGSVNGLLCLTDYRFQYYGKNLYLWNPSVHKFRIVRDSCFARKPDTFVVLGFGFDSRTNDYKVVRVFYDFNLYFSGGKVPDVEVYSINTGVWRKIGGGWIDFPDEQSLNVFVNGAVHGRCSKRRPERIMSFHFQEERFGEIMLPERELDGERSNFKDSIGAFKEALGEMKGSLALFRWYAQSRNCQVWVMEEYGAAESWCKLFTIVVKDRIFQPICFTKDGEVVIQETEDGRRLALCDVKSQELNSVRLDNRYAGAHLVHFRDAFDIKRGLVHMEYGLFRGVRADRMVLSLRNLGRNFKEDVGRESDKVSCSLLKGIPFKVDLTRHLGVSN
ncbi:hypothetical protein RJ639_036880 [Escallonia herrerae]|uniref:F-box domain-containing protein n=1 Tax=Escallonia herrerae TaxID=1293975 RepID=A0AA88WU64_9ASTE|nr:hypothetical protein RJ639_036880 [Escallonia herrerae]